MKSTLALLGMVAMTSQAAALLWDLTVPMYEVQTPSVQDGSCGTPETCAGWWFGYGAEGGTYSPMNPDLSLMTTDPLTGDVIPNGNLTETGLKITLSAPAATATDKPGIAGLGFNFNKPEGPSNITANLGYTISYTSDAALQIELGWDEVTNNYDTWYATLPAQATSAAKSLPWAAFKKDGWGTGTKSWPITEATNNAWSLKIRLKNGTTTDKVANFEIQSLSWLNGTTPGAINSVKPAASLNANLTGRSLAFSGMGKKSVSVEVISLQGQVVSSQVVTAAASTVNLSKVAAGVYVIKAASKGLSFSKMIALK